MKKPLQDTVVNVFINNTLVQIGLISNEQKWEDLETVGTANDEIFVGTDHPGSEEGKGD